MVELALHYLHSIPTLGNGVTAKDWRTIGSACLNVATMRDEDDDLRSKATVNKILMRVVCLSCSSYP